MSDWQPTASLHNLRFRAAVNAKIRHFFADKNVLEVETPMLSQAAVSDPYLVPMQTEVSAPGKPQKTYFLHTSPEYPMKRLLAAGSGSIYQLGKVFRNDECGRRHNPEFTLLEWYRVGFDEQQLMDEVEALITFVDAEISEQGAFSRLTYRSAFQQFLSFDPHKVTLEWLQEQVKTQVSPELELADIDSCLDILMSHVIEPQLQHPTFIYDYPASMSALAAVHKDGQGTFVARRFELYMAGIELANGYFELTHADEQQRRFANDQQKRQAFTGDVLPTDQYLLAALEQGMPSCAGVALGVDRLLMLLLNVNDISQVISFDGDNA